MNTRTGQAPPPLARDAFGERFRANFHDPAFRTEQPAIHRLEAIAWQAYDGRRKVPLTARAGPGFADPDYELSIEWRATRERLREAQARQRTRPRRRGCC